MDPQRERLQSNALAKKHYVSSFLWHRHFTVFLQNVDSLLKRTENLGIPFLAMNTWIHFFIAKASDCFPSECGYVPM